MLAYLNKLKMPSLDQVRAKLISPSSVVITANVVTNITRILSTIVLTRLLAPSDFGAIGIVTAVTYALVMVTDAGFQAFVVRHARGNEPHFLNVIWTIHLVRCVCLSLFIVAISWPLSQLIGKPEVALLMAVTALTLSIEGIASLTNFTALRDRKVGRLSIIELGALVSQVIISLIAAWYLRSAWAVVIGMFANSGIRAICSYLCFPDSKRQLRWDAAIFAELWSFAKIITASSIFTLIVVQADKFIFAKIFSLEEFGVYTVAANLAAAPAAIVTIYVSRIVFPNLADAWRQTPQAMKAISYDLRGLVFYGYLFLAGGLIGVAPFVVRILYDLRYLGAAPILQLLAISAALAMLTRTANELLLAMGRTRAGLDANVVRLAWIGIAGFAGYQLFGPIGLVATFALIELPAYIFYALTQHRLNLLVWNREALALSTIVIGFGVGFATDRLALWLLPWI